MNSSEILVETFYKKISDKPTDFPLKVLILKLPVAFLNASLELDDFLKKHEWDGLLMFGQAAKRSKMSLELKAKNISAPRMPDNLGQAPHGKIIESAEEVLFANWPFSELLLRLNNEHFELSQDAGEYVCNELYFRQLERQKNKPVGFVHLPLLSPQKGARLKLVEAVSSLESFLLLCGAELENR